jgi:hypothetical protein
MAAVIFSGSDVKTLKDNLSLNGKSKLMSGTVDPTSVATSANKGSLYLNTSNGNVYRKTDNGSTINWTAMGTASGLLAISTKTANYTLTLSDDYVEGDATAGDIALTLPSVVVGAGKSYYLKKVDASANLVTVTGTVDGATNVILRQQNDYLHVTSNGTEWKTLAKRKAPTIQKFLSGSGTYTTPVDAKWIQVLLVGGGGGGSGGSNNGTGGQGGSGVDTTFGTTLLVGGGGLGGQPAGASGLGGAGGTASLGTGPVGLALTGGQGGGIHSLAGYGLSGAYGGTNPLGGAGTSTTTSPGNAATANTGAGGGGAGSGTNVYNGAGGGAGGYVSAIIYSPSSTYAYAVGTGGGGGTAGTAGQAGGAGAAGVILVTEFY